MKHPSTVLQYYKGQVYQMKEPMLGDFGQGGCPWARFGDMLVERGVQGHIILAAATSITVATVGQGLTLQAVAGVTKELGQSTLDNLQSISNGAVLREMTDPLASLTDTTMGTSGVCTPNPYTGL